MDWFATFPTCGLQRLPGENWNSLWKQPQTENQGIELLLNAPNLIKPTCWVVGDKGGKHHRAPTSDLENIEDKILIKKSCCSRSQDDGVLRIGRVMITRESCMEPCLSHLWLISASMHGLYPERLLFSLTKDIRIKLIFYYQTLYTTEVANNTEFKELQFFLMFYFFFPLPPKKVQYKTIV